MRKHSHSIDGAVLDRMRRASRRRVFSPADLLDLGSRAAIDQALSRNVRAGRIRRVARGLYDVPAVHPTFGSSSPDVDAVATSVARRDGVRLLPSGAHAANMLGISDQVPVRPVYVTDGRTRRIQFGRQTVLLKHRQPKTLRTKHRTSALVIEALRWLGRRHVDDRTVATLQRRLSDVDKAQMRTDLRYAPAWIAEIMRAVAERTKDR